MEIRRIIDEQTFSKLQKMEGSLSNGKKDEQATASKARPVRKKEGKRGNGMDGQIAGRIEGKRRRR